MPPARQSSAVPRERPRRQPPRLRRIPGRAPALRLRWERLGRISLLLVLGIVVVLYVEHATAYLASRAQASRQQRTVDALVSEHARLTRIERSLLDPTTIVADARRLGMVRPGEIPYSVLGSSGR